MGLSLYWPNNIAIRCIKKKDYKNNNRKINGRKGYLIKKQNNNTITEGELMELESIVTSHV